MNKYDFQIIDHLCAVILDDFNSFPTFEEMHQWLDQNKQLYKQINIQPEGLPAVANCNYEGVKYESIAEFHNLYSKTNHDYNLLDHMSHEEVIIHFIERMDAIMNHQYLVEKEYMGMGFRDFNYHLSSAIHELYANRGNTELITEIVDCKFCNKKQYFFIGEYDESYLHLILKVNNGVVVDFEECRKLKCSLPIKIDPEKQIFIKPITTPL